MCAVAHVPSVPRVVKRRGCARGCLRSVDVDLDGSYAYVVGRRRPSRSTMPDTVAPFAGAVICVVGGVTSVPVPDRLLVCVPTLSLTVKVAALVPYPVGVKVTFIVQLEFAGHRRPAIVVLAEVTGVRSGKRNAHAGERGAIAIRERKCLRRTGVANTNTAEIEAAGVSDTFARSGSGEADGLRTSTVASRSGYRFSYLWMSV